MREGGTERIQARFVIEQDSPTEWALRKAGVYEPLRTAGDMDDVLAAAWKELRPHAPCRLTVQAHTFTGEWALDAADGHWRLNGMEFA